MESKATSLKPFHLEEKKSGPKSTIQDATYRKWQQTLEANIRRNEDWVRVLNQTWNHNEDNLGMEARVGANAASAETLANHVLGILTYIATYAPNCLYRDITKRCSSVKEVWEKVRDWANLSSVSTGFHTYAQLQHSYDAKGDLSPNDFYFLLRDAAEDCLLVKNGKVQYNDKPNTRNEPMSQFVESSVVKDWLIAIGGLQLLNQVFRVYSKELETQTLADLRRRIADNISVLQAEAESSALASRMVAEANIGWTSSSNRNPGNGRGRPSTRGEGARRRGDSRRQESGRGGGQNKGWCQICQAKNLPCRHHLHECPLLPEKDKKAIAKAVEATMFTVDEDVFTTSEDEEQESESDVEDHKPSQKSGKSYKSNKHESKYPIVSPHAQIRAGVVSLYPNNQTLKIYESPILAVAHIKGTVYLVLDTGATTSLMKESKAKAMGLKIQPTSHKAVQVDGQSKLEVVGEVHTSFQRSSKELTFSALVVAGLATDFLAGTNFIIENDVTISMAKNKVTIGDTLTVPTASNTVLQLDQLSKHNLVSVNKRTEIHPGDSLTLSIPPKMAGADHILVEPNLRQTKPFFSPSITKVDNNNITVTNTSGKIINLKKNTQVAVFTATMPGSHKTSSPISNIISPQPTLKPLKLVLQEMVIDGSHKLSTEQKQPFIDCVSRHLPVFGNDLPGYNHHFGKVYAGFEFATKTKPKTFKLRKPSYGRHAELLFNQKCLQMKQQGVLDDPANLDVQPLLYNNAWVVKKASAGNKPWEECTVNEVRVVVGFDFLNKYLQNAPGEVTKPEQIFASVASWKYMAEIDAKDCYFQIPLRTDQRHKKKLAYMCIKTALGTLCFTRAAMGLLGMDVYQDEMMQRIFGDLILKGNLITLADNIYFGADTLEGLSALFEEVLSRCEAADLRIKPSKVHINLKSADILGLHWSAGTLSPSPHKLEPLAHCERPKTVSALRSFIGGVRFQEICLPGPELALASQPLDAQIPASRSGKELINWTSELIQSFLAIQKILKNPLHVTIPRRGDTPYLASDGCTSLPACGTKLFLKRPGVDGFLPSFHHGCRLPERLKEYSPCEVEAYSLSQGVSKNSFYIKMTGEPGVCFVDSKAVYEAKQRMDNGFFSTNRRLQDLLANLSSHRLSVQLISAKLPSPLLQYIDFSSRHPVECTLPDCQVCLEAQKPDTTIMGAVLAEPHIASAAGWREMQRADGDLRQACSIITSGTKLSAKKKHAGDVKKYLRLCKVNKEGLLIVEKTMPFQARPSELIVIPRAYAPNICRLIHIKLDHPLPSQMKKLFSKSYFTLDADAVLQEVYNTCDVPCQASKILPKEKIEYKTETKPLTAGSFLNADVLEEAHQKILVLRDHLTSYTSTMFIPNQTKDTLRDSLLILASRTRRSTSKVTCRVDAHSSFKGLADDGSLEKMGIFLEIGHPKNPNHNSVAETAIKELRQELVRINPHGGPASDRTLALATERLNSRVRHLGLSARELWTSRDQVSGNNLTLNDLEISDKQHAMRQASHASSASYDSRQAPPVQIPKIKPGDTVFVKTDRTKTKARDKFMVLSVDTAEDLATIQKLPMTKFKSNPITVHLRNLYLTRPPSPPKSRLPQQKEPYLAPPPPQSSHTPHYPAPLKLCSPLYPRFTQESSDSEDDEPPTPTEVATVAELHPPVNLNEAEAADDDDEGANDAASIHGDEDPLEEAIDAEVPAAEVENEFEMEGGMENQVIDPPLRAPFTVSLPMLQPKVKRKGEIKVGDTLLRFSKKTRNWEKVRLSKKFTKHYQNGSYKFEYTNLDGSQPRRNFFSPGGYWSLLQEDEIDLDLAELTTDLEITHQNTSEDEPMLEQPEHVRQPVLENELLHPENSTFEEELLMIEQPSGTSATTSPSPIPHLGAAALAQGGGPHLSGNDQLNVVHCSDSLFLMSDPEHFQPTTSSPLETPDTSPDCSLLTRPSLNQSASHLNEATNQLRDMLDPVPTQLTTVDVLVNPPSCTWKPLLTLAQPCINLARTILGSLSREQPRAAASEPAPVPTQIGAEARARVRGLPSTGNPSTPLLHLPDCSLLMSEPLHQAPLPPTCISTNPTADAQERLANDPMFALRPSFPTPLVHPSERFARDTQSTLGPGTSNVASTQERFVSDTSSALWPCSSMLSSTPGSVVPEQSRTAPPTPACTQIPNQEAAAFASVCRPLTTGNLKGIISNNTDPLLHMSTWDPDLQAAYHDLRRHTARGRSASFHASRSPAAIAIRNQAQSPPPRDRQRTCPVEKHRHWSVSCTDLHPPDYDVPYRLL